MWISNSKQYGSLLIDTLSKYLLLNMFLINCHLHYNKEWMQTIRYLRISKILEKNIFVLFS